MRPPVPPLGCLVHLCMPGVRAWLSQSGLSLCRAPCLALLPGESCLQVPNLSSSNALTSGERGPTTKLSLVAALSACGRWPSKELAFQVPDAVQAHTLQQLSCCACGAHMAQHGNHCSMTYTATQPCTADPWPAGADAQVVTSHKREINIVTGREYRRERQTRTRGAVGVGGRDLQLVIVVYVLPEHVPVQGLAVLVDRGLAPASRLEPELCSWGNGSAEPWHLHRTGL